ncbi:transporter substrate-binding protein [Pseudonocardia sp. MCCB 268]|nr:transporter substrate-binding protein [Pseudonocardia cytotoxica]
MVVVVAAPSRGRSPCRHDGAGTRMVIMNRCPLLLLFSSTGGLAAVEQSIAQGALLAVDEVNAAGGVGGREAVGLPTDVGPTMPPHRPGSAGCWRESGAVAAVGGYTSSSRVAMIPAFLGGRALLLYSTYFEGLRVRAERLLHGCDPQPVP